MYIRDVSVSTDTRTQTFMHLSSHNTHTLSQSSFLTHFLTLSHIHPLTHSLSLSHTHTYTLTYKYTHTYSLKLTYSHSNPHTHNVSQAAHTGTSADVSIKEMN